MPMGFRARLGLVFLTVTIVGLTLIVIRLSRPEMSPLNGQSNGTSEARRSDSQLESAAKEASASLPAADTGPEVGSPTSAADRAIAAAAETREVSGPWTANDLSQFEVRIAPRNGGTGLFPSGNIRGEALRDLVAAEMANEQLNPKDKAAFQRAAISRITGRIDEFLIDHFLQAAGLRVVPTEIIEDAVEDTAETKTITFRYKGQPMDGVPASFRLILRAGEQVPDLPLRKAKFVQDCARRIELHLARNHLKNSPAAHNLRPDLLGAFMRDLTQSNLASLLKSQATVELAVPSLQVEPLLDQILRLRTQGILVRSKAGAHSDASGSGAALREGSSISTVLSDPVSHEDMSRIQNFYRDHTICGYAGDEVGMDEAGNIQQVHAIDMLWEGSRFLLSRREQPIGSDDMPAPFRVLYDGQTVRYWEPDGTVQTCSVPGLLKSDASAKAMGHILSERLPTASRSGYTSHCGVPHAVFYFDSVSADQRTRKTAEYCVRLVDSRLTRILVTKTTPRISTTKITQVSALHFRPMAEEKLAEAATAFRSEGS